MIELMNIFEKNIIRGAFKMLILMIWVIEINDHRHINKCWD